jgi:hypothetical protein
MPPAIAREIGQFLGKWLPISWLAAERSLPAGNALGF